MTEASAEASQLNACRLAAVDLIRNAQVQAIIHGARTDAEAEFVVRIGGCAHVPVLSFSVTPAAPAPFSVRAAADDAAAGPPCAEPDG